MQVLNTHYTKISHLKRFPIIFPRLLGITGITMFSVKIVRKWHPPPPLTEYNILRRGVGPRKR